MHGIISTFGSWLSLLASHLVWHVLLLTVTAIGFKLEYKVKVVKVVKYTDLHHVASLSEAQCFAARCQRLSWSWPATNFPKWATKWSSENPRVIRLIRGYPRFRTGAPQWPSLCGLNLLWNQIERHLQLCMLWCQQGASSCCDWHWLVTWQWHVLHFRDALTFECSENWVVWPICTSHAEILSVRSLLLRRL